MKTNKERLYELYKEKEFNVPMEVRKRFVRDFSLPFPVYTNYYFYYYLELYNNLLNTNEKFKMLYEDYCNSNKNWDLYLKEYHKMKDTALDVLASDGNYLKFNECDMNKFKSVMEGKTTKKGDVYNQSNEGKQFVSFDLVQANYTTLKCLNLSVCKEYDNFKSFMSQFGNLKTVMNSKYLRQQVLGKLNGKRLTTVEKYLVSCFMKVLKDNNVFDNDSVELVNKDEVVFNTTLNLDLSKFNEKSKCLFELTCFNNVLTLKNEFLDYSTVLEESPMNFNVCFKMDMYTLEKVENAKGFVRKFNDNSFDFKGVPVTEYANTYKNYLHLPLNIEDKLFVYEGKLACYLE